MAGIGFELKKLFSKRGIILKVRANIYASLVVAGPMIMGVLLLLGAKLIARFGGASLHQQDLVAIIITYSLLFSLLLSSFFLFVLSRFIADMLYIDAVHRILPSMYGALSLLLTVGSVSWAIFLYFCRIDFIYSMLCFILFCEGLVVWIQINYIAAVKEYRSIVAGFFFGLFTGLLIAFLLTYLKYDVVASVLFGVCVAYGVIIIVFTDLLHRFFPMGSGSPLKFLQWIDEYPQLPFIGFFSTLALFAHLMIMWTSPLSEQVEGLFYQAPPHDIAALVAFLTILITSVNFVTSVEVNFYPTYRRYFSLLNGDGSLSNIEKAYEGMMAILKQELFYLAIQQALVTLFSIVLISEVLMYIGLGFTSNMVGMFRVLCVGYALFAIGNSIMLFLMYFSNNTDALIATLTLLVCNILGTWISLSFPAEFYGFGFVFASAVFYLVGLQRLYSYTKRLDYYIFTKQPVFFTQKKGFFTSLIEKLEA